MNRPPSPITSPASQGEVTAIVPAAGRSRRMGSAKPLLPFAGSTVLGSVLSALVEGGAQKVVVVVAPEEEEPRAREIVRLVRRAGQRVAVNPQRDRGMLSSIRAGLDAAGLDVAPSGPVLVCPADLPALSPATVAAVLHALASPQVELALPEVGGRRGHPLAIAPRRVAEIAELDEGVGLRQLLDRHPDLLCTVAVDDPGAIRDVDTPSDYRRLRAATESTTGRGGAKPRW